MSIVHTDDHLVRLVAQLGHEMSHLFLVGGEIFVTADPSSLGASSAYEPLKNLNESERTSLVDLLRRLDAVTYASTDEVDTAIRRAACWESIYQDLNSLLSSLPFATANGKETFYIVDYGDGQHKIECEAREYFETTVLEAIQQCLRRQASDWEVILVGGPKLGPQQAVSIYPDKVVNQWSTEPWYE